MLLLLVLGTVDQSIPETLLHARAARHVTCFSNDFCLANCVDFYHYVPHKAVAEISKIANYRSLVAVNDGSQSKSTDGSKSVWRQRNVVAVVVVIVIVVAM